MTLRSRLLQLARIPLLLILLRFLATPQQGYTKAINTLEPGEMWPPLLVLVATSVLFVGAALAGRDRHQPAWLLAIEGAIAVVFGLYALTAGMAVPALETNWAVQLDGLLQSIVGGPFLGTFQPGLHVTWAVIVFWSAMRQRRRHPASIVNDRISENVSS